MKIELDYDNKSEIETFVAMCQSVVEHLKTRQDDLYQAAVSVFGKDNVRRVGITGLAVNVTSNQTQNFNAGNTGVTVEQLVSSIVTAYQPLKK